MRHGFNHAGAGAVVADSVTSSGPITGTIVRGTTALEFPAHATEPRVRCTEDPDTGIGRTAANELDIITNGASKVLVSNVQAFFLDTMETVIAGELESRGKKVRTRRTQDITAAGNTIDTAGQEFIEVTLTSGAITITASPFIANGDNGQELTIVNVDASAALTLPDESTTPGCNMELRAATRVLAAGGGYLRLRYSSALAAWHEIGFG